MSLLAKKNYKKCTKTQFRNRIKIKKFIKKESLSKLSKRKVLKEDRIRPIEVELLNNKKNL
jgi:hypothetical protein